MLASGYFASTKSESPLLRSNFTSSDFFSSASKDVNAVWYESFFLSKILSFCFNAKAESA